MDQTKSEYRIEKHLRTVLFNCMLTEIKERCLNTGTITCAQVLDRAITHAGPADKIDRQIIIGLRIKAKAVKVTKLYQHMVKWEQFRLRLTKYGFSAPDCNLLLKSRKAVCQSLRVKDSVFRWEMDNFVRPYSSRPGLISLGTISSFWSMAVLTARTYEDQVLDPPVRGSVAAGIRNGPTGACWSCGSLGHWKPQCPKEKEKEESRLRQEKASWEKKTMSIRRMDARLLGIKNRP